MEQINSGTSVKHLFLYGNNRPDHPKLADWAKKELNGLTQQRAIVKGSALFWLEYKQSHHAVAVLEQPEDAHIVGWLISTNGDDEVFEKLLYEFDSENGYVADQPSVSWFIRTTVDATLIQGENFELDGTIKTYIYHKKPSNVKSSKYLFSGNWLDKTNF